AAQLRPLLGTRDELDAMTKYAREQRLLVAKLVEMRSHRGSTNVAHARVAALDALVCKQRFQPADGNRGRVEELPGAPLPIAADQRGRIEPQPGQNLTGVA